MNHEDYMQRALDFAQLGLGSVSTNPMVGCVIVYEGKIIGEGYHQKCGKAHAEVNAINSVVDKRLLPKSTLYVTLEPCSHYGKTPPCSDLIIQHKIPKVLICNQDPFDKVNGSGIQKLKDAGVEVEIGILENQGRFINKRFFTFHEHKRPYVIIKWAQTQDGFVARKNYDSKWISNSTSRKLVHKWRTEEDSILVGFNTAKHDNPSLTAREWKGENPIRVLLDRDLNISKEYNLLDRKVKTIVINTLKSEVSENLIFEKVDFINLEEEILNLLFKHNLQSVFIEGGSKTLQGFIDKGLWDEARVFTSNTIFKDGISAPILHLKSNESLKLENDQLNIYYK